ncbi:electron transfer flavoprotein beta subunit lysine methyltransferase-like isoform X2 [Oratosquilla oratoria]
MATPEESPFPEPFWGFYWPGGQALTRFILDSPSLVVKQKVLDFGCGCGASGLAAKIMKAESVTFNDIDKDAMIAVQLNGSLNNIAVDKFASENLIGSSCKDYDVILVGDMLYDSEFADSLFIWLKELHQRGKKIYIGDPGRYAIAEHPLCNELRCLAKYQLLRSTVLENKGHSQSYVWTFS